jgi:glycosyltransferase involved in cell wall biosynthesis
VLSSRNEGTPVALIEAMAAGCAIVATRVGGVPDVVEDGVTGLLVSPGDPAALAESLLMLARSPDTVRAMGRRARAGVSERYGVGRLIDDIETLYTEGLDELRGEGASWSGSQS